MNPEPTSADDAIRFPSLESLRAAHTGLLKEFRAEEDKTALLANVETFIRRGRATGALLDAEADRWTAQSQLDYWATQLYQPGREAFDSTLDEFDPQLAPDLDDALCPYMGLDAFHERNQAIFFGRERLVGELIDRLKSARFLAVLGASGSGKSSVVRAGLIGKLKNGALPGSAAWNFLPTVVPGSDPLLNLARLTLPPGTDTSLAQQEAALFRQNPAHLPQVIAARFNGDVVLVVDQFEELFTLCGDEANRLSFVENLISLCQAPEAGHRIIITMRVDFEANLARLPILQTLVEQNMVRITPLSASELREAIEAPAAQIGLRFEEGVVNALLNDTLGEPAALPLLQFTLLKLWERRDHNRITWEAYRKLGDGRRALANSADEFYKNLIPEEQVTMRRLLMKMVRPGEGLEVTSGRVSRLALQQNAESLERQDRVLEKLINAHLVRVSEGDIAADEQFEVAHEALVRNWPRLVEWLDEERSALRQRHRLTSSAEEWLRLNRDPSALWRGVLLQQAHTYADLNSLETEFIEASTRAQQDEFERTLNDVLSQAAKLRRGRNFLYGALGFAILLAVIAGVFAYQAIMANYAATQQGMIARAGELAAQSVSLRDTQVDLALLLSVEAEKLADTYNTKSALLDNLQYRPQLLAYLRAHTKAAQSVAFGPDGKLFASAGSDGSLILWDMATRKPLATLSGAKTPITTLAFSPGGEMLASLSIDGTISFWDVAAEKINSNWGTSDTGLNGFNALAFSPVAGSKTLAAATRDGSILLFDVDLTKSSLTAKWALDAPDLGAVSSLVFSPDGKTLAAGSCVLSSDTKKCSQGVILLWDVTSHTLQPRLTTSNSGPVTSLAFSPDGFTLASASNEKNITLWDLQTQPILATTLTGHTFAVNSLAFSPLAGSKILVSASDDASLMLWDLSNPQPLGQPLIGHKKAVNSAAFSPDGKYLVSGSADTTLILWSVQKFHPLSQTFRGNTAAVTSLAISPDGKTLAAANNDHTILLWNVAARETIATRFLSATESVTSLAFSPDGKTLAAASTDSTILLADVTSLLHTSVSLHGHKEAVTSVAFSPDGKTLASASKDQTILLWDISTHAMLGAPLTGHTGAVTCLAFSPDGKNLVSGGEDASLILYDVATRKQIGQPLTGHKNSVNSVAFSPDGKTIVSGSSDNTLIRWDEASGTQLGAALTGHTSPVSSVAFSPLSGGKTIVSGSWDSSLILWDVASGQAIGQPLVGHSNAVTSIAFSPDGKSLFSGSEDKTLLEWKLDLVSWQARACAVANRNLTQVEWIRYFGDASTYRSTCADLPLEASAQTPQPKLTPLAAMSPVPATMPPSNNVRSRVLVLNFDPPALPASWSPADTLTTQFISAMQDASGGLVQYQVVNTITIHDFPVFVDGQKYDAASYAATLADDKKALRDANGVNDLVDYQLLLQQYNILSQVTAGQIDEVWVFGGPYFGLYQSRMVGKNAFWTNSPALEADSRRFVIMGFDVQRNVREMIHDFGHRSESILAHQYGSENFLQLLYGNPAPAPASLPQPKNDFETFLLTKGTVHRAPGGVDYGNDEAAWLKAFKPEWFPLVVDPNKAN